MPVQTIMFRKNSLVFPFRFETTASSTPLTWRTESSPTNHFSTGPLVYQERFENPAFFAIIGKH